MEHIKYIYIYVYKIPSSLSSLLIGLGTGSKVVSKCKQAYLTSQHVPRSKSAMEVAAAFFPIASLIAL
jgi:hypothetical protein